MGRRAAKIDANQPDLVKTMRDMGVSVEITSGVHDGFTDLVIGYGGVTVLVEVKDGSRVLSERKLTKDQTKFHGRFKGAITVIETFGQAVALANEIRRVAQQINPVWNMGAAANNNQNQSNGA
ncbi:MAG: hypothetical protein KAT62_03695 [Desulfuromonadales bacterium]|nr:hypothetical protein [Desulfuromonadales bacterium]